MEEKRQNKRKLNRGQTKKLLPAIKAFNKAAKLFINILSKQIEEKEKKVSNIRVMVNDFPMPSQRRHNISIQTLDLNKTAVRKKGENSYNQLMDWERELRNKKRGFIL